MGMQGPLTAQALGRSPYDDVVEWDDDHDEHSNGNDSGQQFDHRGRPVNPETKRINRDIIRSHNEVMLVIGVAEQENPTSNPEAESDKRHAMYEDDVGINLAFSALRCVDAAGAFGLDGFRQRVLIYKPYSHIPFWDLYAQSRNTFSISRDLLPGASVNLFSNYADRQVALLWRDRSDRVFARRLAHEVWSYVRVHLELYIALQRLGLASSTHWLPSLSFFIPFTQDSPIPAPPPPKDLSFQSLLQWIGGLCIASTPFLVWVMTQRLIRDWRPQIWARIFRRLPNTGSPPGMTTSWVPADRSRERPEHRRTRSAVDDVSPIRPIDGQMPSDTGPVEAVRRPSTFSARGDDYASDEEDNEGVSATLISFDVEATAETSEAPPGLWSAELRPSVDARGTLMPTTTYCDTMLTQLPPLIASHIFADAILRLVTAPWEATALRLIARTFRQRLGLPTHDICGINMLSQINLTFAINFLGTQVLHLALCGEIWAAFTTVATVFHATPDEWREAEAEEQEKRQEWPDERS
ncbi:hypothetical protein F53441_11122 [Fusarium austroafricanum]|uniref:Uncharacterized protein n=1 Tax=Fusarium austroafricanum TaxID=2364996 RepID=A0A8H4P0T7_9HYPO|nr:hypothetical protein F53441_11122 [Fusarium austroafricanum]